MRNVLRMLRPITTGQAHRHVRRGGRARRRRAAAASRAPSPRSADHAVITNEDPRGEDPDAILDEIAGALKSAGFGRKFDREFDRRQAIEKAFERAGKGDTVLLAGKGTEQSIVIGATHWPWDERRIARELLQEAARRRIICPNVSSRKQVNNWTRPKSTASRPTTSRTSSTPSSTLADHARRHHLRERQGSGAHGRPAASEYIDGLSSLWNVAVGHGRGGARARRPRSRCRSWRSRTATPATPTSRRSGSPRSC